MARYLLWRILASVPTLLFIYTLVFLIAHATPGSPWDIDTNRPMDPAVKAALDARFGLDRPLAEQYVLYLKGAAHGDLGASFRNPALSVNVIIRQFLPVSLQLGAAAMLTAAILGPLLGGWAALTRFPAVDSAIRVLSTVGISMPTYVVTSILIVVFGVKLGWVPTLGWHGIFSTSALVPIFALALAPLGAIIRYFRSSMLEVRHLDHVRTAHAKGLHPWIVLVRHMGRNALIPVVTIIGVYASYVLVGSFFVETIAGVPGFGRYFVLSVNSRDYPVIIGATLVYAVVVVAVNLLVDLSYVFLDPRVRVA